MNTMINEEAGFLTAIRNHPDDDTARLVYADWLQEHDQPERAEFIRGQIALHHGSDRSLQKRTRELLALHWQEWFPVAAGKAINAWASVHPKHREPAVMFYERVRGGPQFTTNEAERLGGSTHYQMWFVRRGFVDEVVACWSHWQDRGDRLLKCEPVQKVALTTVLAHPVVPEFTLAGTKYQLIEVATAAAAQKIPLAVAAWKLRWPGIREWSPASPPQQGH